MTENTFDVDFPTPSGPVYGFVCQFCGKLNRNPRPQVLDAIMINDVIQQVLKNSRGKIRANVQHQIFGESIPYRAEDSAPYREVQ